MLDFETFEDFAQGLCEGYYYLTFDADEDSPELTMGMHCFVSLYFYEPPTMAKREAVYGLCERFQAWSGDALKLVTFGRGAVHKVGSKYGQIRGKKENIDPSRSLFLSLSDGRTENDSPRFYFDAMVNKADHQQAHDLHHNSYSWLRLGMPMKGITPERLAGFMALAQDAANALGAEQGYGGIGWALPMNNHAFPDFEATERYLADRFYGLDIDKPFYMTSGHEEKWTLEKGLRSPSWLTFVGQEWLPKLGGAEALTAQLLKHPQVRVIAFDHGLIIQAGDAPQIYPVEDGVPSVMMHIAHALKPARAQTLNLLSYARWDGDEEIDHVFFDLNECARWLGRFDGDSDWPSAEQRWLQTGAVAGNNKPRLRGLPGEKVPASGPWWTPALTGDAARVQLEVGETFPGPEFNDYGQVIWYLG